ncbi:MAG: OsmC family protein [Thermodesulfobacteriota bacterium]
MYRLVLNGTPRIDVAYRDKTISYATDGSLVNPLEATYAALAGCAGVYAIKACKKLGISDAGIDIQLKPMVKAANPAMPGRIVTTVSFPPHIGREQRDAILESIGECAVKKLIRSGSDVEFQVAEAEAGG